ncbi:MAG: glycosyltransferase family 4 protein, partial [Salibacteraceae bacterium]
QVLTRNRDWFDPTPYALEADQWLTKGRESVFYVSRDIWIRILKMVVAFDGDVIYFNGFYSPKFNALPLIYFLATGTNKQLIVAPRGMLNSNAIALKSFQKKRLISMYKLLGIQRKVLFHATDDKELQAIKSVYPSANICTLSNVPPIVDAGSKNLDDDLIFISVGRLSKVKNTLGLIEIFRSVLSNKVFFIGSADNKSYERACLDLTTSSKHIIIKGAMPPSGVKELYNQRSIFVSMTTGENFGHAIIEAMAAGCPVIISDQTPWNDLEDFGAGWVIPLDQPERWQQQLKACSEMSADEYHKFSDRAKQYVREKFDFDEIRKQYLNLFRAEY